MVQRRHPQLPHQLPGRYKTVPRGRVGTPKHPMDSGLKRRPKRVPMSSSKGNVGVKFPANGRQINSSAVPGGAPEPKPAPEPEPEPVPEPAPKPIFNNGDELVVKDLEGNSAAMNDQVVLVKGHTMDGQVQATLRNDGILRRFNNNNLKRVPTSAPAEGEGKLEDLHRALCTAHEEEGTRLLNGSGKQDSTRYSTLKLLFQSAINGCHTEKGVNDFLEVHRSFLRLSVNDNACRSWKPKASYHSDYEKAKTEAEKTASERIAQLRSR